MLEIVNKGNNDNGDDWNTVWNNSTQFQGVIEELDKLHEAKKKEPVAGNDGADAHSEFAMPFRTQLTAVTVRVFQQYWRMPSYIFAKWILSIAAGLFIGFTFFDANGTQAGIQSIIFSVFMLTTIFSTLVNQVSS